MTDEQEDARQEQDHGAELAAVGSDTTVVPAAVAPHVAHTPTPWKVYAENDYDNLGRFEVIGVDGRDLAMIRSAYRTVDEQRANAECIVRAVNSHQVLTDALTQIVEWLAEWQAHSCPGFDCAICDDQRYMDLARAALAKAEGR